MIVVNERMPNSWAANHRRMGTGVTPLVRASVADIPMSCIMSSKQRRMWGNVRVEPQMRFCWHIFSISSGRADRITRPSVLFLLGRGLPPKSFHLAVGASFFGQLEGWPNSFTLATLRGEFFRESSQPPTPSVRLMACHFPEGEGDA